MTGDDQEPDISIIVPTHNVGVWVGECVESILRETEVSIEVLVVDDGSTDETVEIVEAIAARDPRLRLVRALGIGGAQARDQGVELARGEFIAFADGDDIVPDGAYAAMFAAAQQSGSDLVVGRFFKYFLGKTWHPTRRWSAFDEERRGITLADEPSLIGNRACWNRLFRRAWWIDQHIRFPSVPRSNDIVPMTKALTRAKSIDVVTDIVYIYRDRPGNSSMTSRASAAESLESYLSQEAQCRSLVESVASDQLLDEYDELLFSRDGWVHLSKFLLSEGWRGVPNDRLARIESWIGHLVGLVRDRELPGVPVEIRWAWALAGLGDWAAAMLVAAELKAATDNPVWPQPEVWLDQAVRVSASANPSPSLVRATLNKHVLEPIASGKAAQSVGLALALADSTELLRQAFAYSAQQLTAKQQQILLMVEHGFIGHVPPPLPQATVESILVEAESVRIQLTLSGDSECVSELSLEFDGKREVIPIERYQEGSAVGRYPIALVGHAPVNVFANVKTQFGVLYDPLRMSPALVSSRPSGPLLVATPTGGLRLVPVGSSTELSRDELVDSFLSASVTSATSKNEHLSLVITPEREAKIIAVRLWRQVNGSILSRSFATAVERNGEVTATRRSKEIRNRRWLVLATFTTPVGPIEYPVAFTSDVVRSGDADYAIRALGNSGLQLVSESSAHPKGGHTTDLIRDRLANRLRSLRPSRWRHRTAE